MFVRMWGRDNRASPVHGNVVEFWPCPFHAVLKMPQSIARRFSVAYRLERKQEPCAVGLKPDSLILADLPRHSRAGLSWSVPLRGSGLENRCEPPE